MIGCWVLLHYSVNYLIITYDGGKHFAAILVAPVVSRGESERVVELTESNYRLRALFCQDDQ